VTIAKITRMTRLALTSERAGQPGAKVLNEWFDEVVEFGVLKGHRSVHQVLYDDRTLRRVAEAHHRIHSGPRRRALAADAGVTRLLLVRALLLAERMGREAANRLLGELSSRVSASGSSLKEALLTNGTVTEILSPREIDAAMDPASYLGAAQELINRALTMYRSSIAVAENGPDC